MWNNVARIILRNRIALLTMVGVATIFMAFFASKVKPLQKMSDFLPHDHPVSIAHQEFIDQYGHDGTVFVIGVETDSLYQLPVFKAWQQLGRDINTLDGIDSVFSAANLYVLARNDSQRKFEFKPLTERVPETQSEVDSLRQRIEGLPFYRDVLYNDSSSVHLMMVFVNGEKFNSDNRGMEVDSTIILANQMVESHGFEVHYSGMPYIRAQFSNRVKSELTKFLILAFVVTTLILFLFFRSLKVTFFSMLVVSVGMIFSLGMIGLFGYRLSMLMGLIPPLMTVIGVPNCVYLLNKYQSEYRMHGNKIKALSRVIQKVGNATFMTNTTTALGFATFIFTESTALKEFGVIASICIMSVFFVSILLIPIIFSYLPGPAEKQTRHLEQRWLKVVVESLVNLASSYRSAVYLVTLGLIGAGLYGLTLIETTGNMVDDLPSDDPMVEDLRFFEDHFAGVMPFEVLVDVREPKRVIKEQSLKKIEQIQLLMDSYKEFSRSVSIVDAIKFSHQSFYGTYPEDKYVIPDKTNSSTQIRSLLSTYIKNAFDDTAQSRNFFMDSTFQSTRITASIADVGTVQMDSIIEHISPRIDSILNPDRMAMDSLLNLINNSTAGTAQRDSAVIALYDFRRIRRFVRNAYRTKYEGDSIFMQRLEENPDTIYALASHEDYGEFISDVVEDQYMEVTLTGSSVVFLEGTNFLVRNLFISLLIAIALIAILMAVLFRSIRMVMVSLLPNLLPLLFTGALMGYLGIPIKPSTILVFSIAFGISIDDTIHFLAKYRQELKTQSWFIKGSVVGALRETGVSMIYTSIILFFGFVMFTASSFGGIVALGALVSVTLMVAMLTNLVLLPSLLLSFDKSITNKAFREPLLEIIDEEEDIDLEDLVVKKIDSTDNTLKPSES